MREVLRLMFDRASEEYPSAAHPGGFLVNTAPELAANRAHNRAITATRLEEMAGSAGANRDTETLAAFAHVLLVGLSSYSRDGASEEQLRRVSDLALTVIRE